ncbi:MAG: hypothetical protein KA715_13075 [Xanthomonadaceae bacterium]|nr:hypothetical protein [Xanthomonadaceae bacterium]
MNISNLINRHIWFGIALGWSGTLVDATSQLMHGASKQRMMSLGKWNRALLGQKQGR